MNLLGSRQCLLHTDSTITSQWNIKNAFFSVLLIEIYEMILKT